MRNNQILLIKWKFCFYGNIFSQQLQLDQLKSIQKYRTDVFTTNREEGFIEIIKKRQRDSKAEEYRQDCVDFIVITTDFLMLEHKDPDGINYMVPYSLHSNYQEMENLVKAVCPSILRRLVLEIYKLSRFRKQQVIDNIRFYGNYVQGLRRHGEGGYSQLKQKYTGIHTLSREFRQWMNVNSQAELLAQLQLDVLPDKNLRKRKKKEISEKEQSQLDYIYENNLLQLEKKQSLSEISSQLKSTHNNKRIDQFFSDSLQLPPKMKKSFLSDKDSQEQSNILDNPMFKNLFNNFLSSKHNLNFLNPSMPQDSLQVYQTQNIDIQLRLPGQSCVEDKNLKLNDQIKYDNQIQDFQTNQKIDQSLCQTEHLNDLSIQQDSVEQKALINLKNSSVSQFLQQLEVKKDTQV